jgi:hypothetical protein
MFDLLIKNKEIDNFERHLISFYDYPAATQLTGATLSNA